MKTDYDSDGLKGMFREVMQEFFGEHGTPPPSWNVAEDDRESSNIVPSVTSGDDPISVMIVNAKPTVVVERGSLAWGGQSTFVTDVPQIIVGKDARRRSVTIKNLSMNDVALGPTPGIKYVAPPGFGPAILPAGDAVVLHTRGDIYGVAATGSTGEGLSIYQIFDDGQ